MKNGFVLDKILAEEWNVQEGQTNAANKGLRIMGGKLLTEAKALIPEALRFQNGTDERVYRAQLIFEECAEVVIALGKKNEVALADGIADAIYVLLGTADIYGLDMEEVFAEVHRSNMTKDRTPNDPRMKKKGDDYEPPDIEAAIERGRS
jgi:predicted HAD superfamily Cof-like phosphohydrolase